MVRADSYQDTTLNDPVFSQDTTLTDVIVQNGMTLQNANVLISDGSSDPLAYGVRLDGTQAISGNGTISFSAGSYSSHNCLYDTTGTFTIDSCITVTSGAGGGTVGSYFDPFSQVRDLNEVWINHGTLSANTAGSTLSLMGTWRNDGTLVLSAGTLALGGNYSTPDIARISQNGGTLSYQGTLTNSAATFNVAGSGGTFRFAGITINGGTLIDSSSTPVINSSGATLNHVTIGSDMTIASGTSYTVADSLTLASGVTLQEAGTLTLQAYSSSAAQTLSGSGQLKLASGFLTSSVPAVISQQTTVSGMGQIDAFGGLDNQGTIIADGSTLLINAQSYDSSASCRNEGMLVARNGGTLLLGGDIVVGGLGSLDSSGGGIYLSGTLENAGNTLQLVGANTQLRVGGHINGGMIQTADGASLVLQGYYNNFSFLQGVTLDTDVTLGASNTAYLTYATVITPGHSILAKGSMATLNFDASFAGDVRLQSANSATAINGSGSIMTIGPGMTIRTDGGNGSIGSSYTTTAINNSGSVWCQTPGNSIRIGATGVPITNTGMLHASAGSMTASGPLTNRGSILVDGGVLYAYSLDNTAGTLSLTSGGLQLGGTVDLGKLVNFNRSGGTVSLNGTFNNSGSTADLAAVVGAFSLGRGANIIGGKVVAPVPGQPIEVIDGPATITNGMIVDNIDVAPAATLSLSGVWSNQATISATNATIVFTGTRAPFPIGSFNTSGTLFQIGGTLNNASETFPNFIAPGGTIAFVGYVNGGTLDASTMPINLGTFSYNGATFNDVTVKGLAAVTASLAANFTNSLTLAGGEIDVNAASRAYFPGSVTLGGSGSVVLNADRYFGTGGMGGTLTIGPGVVVQGGAGTASLGSDSEGANSFTFNQGTVSAQTAGQAFLIYSNFTNQGSVRVANGATLTFDSYAPSNLVGGVLTGGNWYIGGNSGIGVLFSTASVSINRATVQLDGPGSNGNFFKSLYNNQGTLIISGGLNDVCPTTFTNSGNLTINRLSALKTYRLTNTGSITLEGGLIIDYSDQRSTAPLVAQLGSHILTDVPGKTVGYVTSYETGSASFFGSPITALSVLLCPATAGDCNLDGKIDISDLTLLARWWQSTNVDWYRGDFNYDGKVDISDLTLLATNFGAGATGPLTMDFNHALALVAEQTGSSVPEPAVALLLSAGLLARRSRRSSRS